MKAIKGVDGVTVALAATLAVLVVVEALFAPHYRPVFPWHNVSGYMGGIGLMSCIVVVYLSRFAGKKFLQRPEDSGETHDRD